MKNYVQFLFFILLFSCSNSNKKIISEDTIVFSLGKENINLHESLIDSISIIQLNDNDKSMISYVKKAVVSNDKIFISDFNFKRPILVFDMNGNFLNKIGERGNSKSEFIMISDFTIDDDYVYIYDGFKKALLKYDHYGKYIKADNTNFRADAIQKINTGFLFSIAKENNDKKIIITDNELNITNKYFSYNLSDKDNKLTDNIFQKSNGDIYYNKPVDNFIYKFDMNGKYLNEYYFDFGNRAVPNKIMGDYEKLSKERLNNNYIYFYDAPFVVGDVLIGGIFKGENKAVFTYNIKTREYCINELIPGKVDFMKIILPLGVVGNKVIGYVNFSVYDNIINKSLFSNEHVVALRDGTILLCMYHLQ